MSDQPWLGDACSLVDAFRAGELSPLEALDASLGAIERSQLNAFCHVDPERSRAITELAKRVLENGSALVLADDTFAAARHAAEHGWIDAAALGDIGADIL